MPRHKPKTPEDAMDDAYSEPEDGEAPSTDYISHSESPAFPTPFELPEAGMAPPQPLPTTEPEPDVLELANGSRILSLPDSNAGVAGSSAPESMPVVYTESDPPVPPVPTPAPPVSSAPLPAPPVPEPSPAPAPVPEPVSFSSPAVLACLQDIMTRIRDDETYARNLRVRLATMQSNDQGPLTKLIDVIRGA